MEGYLTDLIAFAVGAVVGVICGAVWGIQRARGKLATDMGRKWTAEHRTRVPPYVHIDWWPGMDR